MANKVQDTYALRNEPGMAVRSGLGRAWAVRCEEHAWEPVKSKYASAICKKCGLWKPYEAGRRMQ